MKTSYKNYFKVHYRSTFSEIDIARYRQWFYAQWVIIKKQVSVSKNIRVLEIGSGIGGVYSILKDEGLVDYVGIELDGEVVKFANKHFKKKVFHNISIEDFKDNKKFDVVFAFEVLEHVENPSIVIDKIFDLLKPRGVFCGTSPFPYKKNVLADSTHMFVLHPSNWERLFERSGFSNIKLRSLTFFPLLWRVNKKANINIQFYLPFRNFITTCLIIARK